MKQPKSEGAMLRHQTHLPLPAQPRGFTLVELMVTVAIIGILAMVAVPSMTSMIGNSRLKGQAEEVQASLQLARSEAVRQNISVTAQATDGTHWEVKTKNDVLRQVELTGGVQISSNKPDIKFKPSGLAGEETKVCVQSDYGIKVMTVLISGVIKMANTGSCS